MPRQPGPDSRGLFHVTRDSIISLADLMGHLRRPIFQQRRIVFAKRRHYAKQFSLTRGEIRLFLAAPFNNLVKGTIPLWYTDLAKLPRRSLATRPFSDCATGPWGRESFRGGETNDPEVLAQFATHIESPKPNWMPSFFVISFTWTV